MAHSGCELVQLRALTAATEAGLPLLIRNLDEHAPVTLISSDVDDRSAKVHDEPVSAER
jgi:hypothetical protein